MDKEKVTINDIIDSLAVKTNDYLRNDDNKKNKDSALFWIFKCIILVLLIIIINWIFNDLKYLGVSLIYFSAKSLRSILSGVWMFSLSFMKELLVVYLLYDNFKIFTNSSYYKSLYQKKRKMKKRKETVSKVIDILLKVWAVSLMIISISLGVISVFSIITIILMYSHNIYIVSPMIILIALLLIFIFTFLHIRNKFFDKKQTIKRAHFIVSFTIFLIGVAFFGYELSSYEKANYLPAGMDLTIKEEVFELKDNQKVYLKADSKLDNLKVIKDDNLGNEVKIEVEYYKTANVRYIYEFNDNNDIKLVFTSSLNIKDSIFDDIFNLIYNTFNRKTIYNYNLFKYPNIYVYVNSNNYERVIVK